MSFVQRSWALLALIAVAFYASPAIAGLITPKLAAPPLMQVGNANNVPDPATGHGAVAYAYQISSTEVTVDEYVTFLNAVAKTDSHGLFSTISDSYTEITRTGVPGTYAYSAVTGTGNFPVARVSWYSAARYVNWLENGTPIGPQTTTTTETGVYNLALGQTTRDPSALFALPTIDEWYKAAYYDPAKGGTGGYWQYPTMTDTAPTSTTPGATLHAANFINGTVSTHFSPVGGYTNSASYYGTYDQGGNVAEWTEAGSGANRPTFGGAFDSASAALAKNASSLASMTLQYRDVGFRVVELSPGIAAPEPATLAMLAFGGLTMLPMLRRYRRGRR